MNVRPRQREAVRRGARAFGLEPALKLDDALEAGYVPSLVKIAVHHEPTWNFFAHR